MKQANQKYTILYGRLSQEDDREGESNSIQNQRMMLENTPPTTVLKTPCSFLTMATAEPILTDPPGTS